MCQHHTHTNVWGPYSTNQTPAAVECVPKCTLVAPLLAKLAPSTSLYCQHRHPCDTQAMQATARRAACCHTTSSNCTCFASLEVQGGTAAPALTLPAFKQQLDSLEPLAYRMSSSACSTGMMGARTISSSRKPALQSLNAEVRMQRSPNAQQSDDICTHWQLSCNSGCAQQVHVPLSIYSCLPAYSGSAVCVSATAVVDPNPTTLLLLLPNNYLWQLLVLL